MVSGNSKCVGVGVAIGTAIGVTLGVVLANPPLWIGLGGVISVVTETAIAKGKR